MSRPRERTSSPLRSEERRIGLEGRVSGTDVSHDSVLIPHNPAAYDKVAGYPKGSVTQNPIGHRMAEHGLIKGAANVWINYSHVSVEIYMKECEMKIESLKRRTVERP